MNASNCECQTKKNLFSGWKVSIYPFFLMMGVAIFFSLIKSDGLIKANIAPENISFGAITSAVLVLFTSIFRVLYKGTARDWFIKIIIYLSNIATDLGFGAVGFYVGAEVTKNGLVAKAVFWFVGSILYWIVLNVLHSTPVVDSIPRQYRSVLIYVALPALCFVIAIFYFFR